MPTSKGCTAGTVLLTLGGIFVCIVLYFLYGYLTLEQKQEDIAAANGDVWNVNDRAAQVLFQDYDLLIVSMEDRQDLVDKIVQGRQDYEAAVDEGNPDGATEVLKTSLLPTFRVIVEAYPDLSIQALQVGVLDEVSGSLNRITYARNELIARQKEFNKLRLYFPLLGYERVEILGENDNPRATIPGSIRDQITPEAN